MPAAIGEDLQRRDFTVNAMAIELVSGDARLLDPHGGRADAARRHVRVLHPLSFVEDPTRLFRAARYAARLGYALDQWTARCARLAVRHAPYAALSGTRIVTEIDRIVEDARPGVALRRLGTGGVFRLLDRRYRFTGRTALRLDQIETAIARARALDPHARLLDLVLLTLLEDQPPDVRATALRRLGLDGEPFARLLHALDGRPRLLAALRDAATPSARARLLRRRTTAELVWLTLGDDDTRRAVEHFASGEHGAVPVLRGEDVIGLGVPRGPEVARVLGRLRDARLDGVVQDRDAEADYVRRWLDTGKGD
jgi:tRNA nucleotidyltransferase (CCA-adding enzyme)